MKNYFSSSTNGAQTFLITALVGTLLVAYMYGFGMTELVLVLLGYFVYGCLGIVVTYHRRLTHNSYKTCSWLIKTL